MEIRINVYVTERLFGEWKTNCILEDEPIKNQEDLVAFIKDVARMFKKRGTYAWSIENAVTYDRIAHRNLYDKEWLLG